MSETDTLTMNEERKHDRSSDQDVNRGPTNGSQARDDIAGGACVGLALSGGIVRGMAHIGVLMALRDANIPIHCVAGTSAGAISGAAYCAGVDPHVMHEWARHMNWLRWVGPSRNGLGLLSTERAERVLSALLGGDPTFDQLRLPFAAISADLADKRQAIKSSGRVIPAVRASCSIAFLFDPVIDNGQILVDGYWSENVPIFWLRDQQRADIVIAVDVMRPSARPITSRWHVLEAAMTLLARTHEQAPAADVVIAPELDGLSWVRFGKIDAYIEAGRRAGEAAIPEIRRLLRQAAASAALAPTR